MIYESSCLYSKVDVSLILELTSFIELSSYFYRCWFSLFFRYLCCGAWAGKLFCLVMIVGYLFWQLLELWQVCTGLGCVLLFQHYYDLVTVLLAISTTSLQMILRRCRISLFRKTVTKRFWKIHNDINGLFWCTTEFCFAD
jgi:hypothetical protein